MDSNFFVKYLTKEKKEYAVICEQYFISKKGLICLYEDGSLYLYQDFFKILRVEESGD